MNAVATTDVYIVDDVPSMRARLAEYITDIPGVKVVGGAGSADDAIAGILDTHPSCVLLDYKLIGGTGVDVLRAVHARSPGTVFVVLTNSPDPQYRRACMEAGADHFFDKSSEFERIGEVIQEMRQTSR
jgi:DNA-binding NarL/FixJ family response regulator